MKFLELVYGNEQVWGDPAVDIAALIAEVDAFNASLRASGELVAVEGLVTAPRAVRAQSGSRSSATGRTWRPRSTSAPSKAPPSSPAR